MATTNLISLYFLAIVLLFVACKPDENFDSPYCRTTQSLGTFQPQAAFPHQSAVIKNLKGGTNTGQLQINQTTDFQQFNQQASETLDFTYDCLRYFSEIKYTWSIPQKKAVFAVKISGTNTWLLVRQAVLVHEAKPGNGHIGTATEFFSVNTQAVNTFRTEPFMRIMTEPKLTVESDSLKLNAQFADTLTLAGQLYQNVYFNSTNLLGEVHKYYYTEQQGVVALKDRYGIVWLVD